MNRLKDKRIILIAAALLLVLVTGTVVYATLRFVASKDSPSKTTKKSDTPTTKPKPTQTSEADKVRRAGETALSEGDYKTAEAKFAEAKDLYSKDDDTNGVAEMNDMLDYVREQTASGAEKPTTPTADSPDTP